MSAPNWDNNQVLTWSGKWHIAITGGTEHFAHKDYMPTLCGVYGYKREHVPKYVARLQSIATGMKQAPLCKKCERSNVASQGDGQ
ncbi:hypothetical protein CCUG60885_04218 [Mycobacteroides salmoniphilum]|uniref:Uncharacterized protein n=1 Tax=Mycobacteroides salmoniphilum TaxID=404941 RepID=A0A4R8SC28_9MYCO|nr:hypothetical protein CCUG60885_04218 [Mycobacteroides salmoniphilum]TEA07334.1 hypothetical protein CCUG60883_01367 [Mycobacteroides salmoniphilum]